MPLPYSLHFVLLELSLPSSLSLSVLLYHPHLCLSVRYVTNAVLS
jgi:hypothetical protein